MYEIHSCIIDTGHFTDLKKKKNLRKTVWAMMALYHMIFYMILSCYKLSIKLDLYNFL